eukprot:jgi/Bigna1/67992/fgenesh1_pg.5_\
MQHGGAKSESKDLEFVKYKVLVPNLYLRYKPSLDARSEGDPILSAGDIIEGASVSHNWIRTSDFLFLPLEVDGKAAIEIYYSREQEGTRSNPDDAYKIRQARRVAASGRAATTLLDLPRHQGGKRTKKRPTSRIGHSAGTYTYRTMDFDSHSKRRSGRNQNENEMIQRLMKFTFAPPSAQTIAWDPNTKAPNVVLEGHPVRTVSSFASNCGVLANTALASGVYSWEVRIDTMGDLKGKMCIGVSTKDAWDPEKALGASKGTWSYHCNSWTNLGGGRRLPYGDVYGEGDVIGIVVDTSSGEIECTKNNTSLGLAHELPAEMLQRSIYPAITLGKGDRVTIRNFQHRTDYQRRRGGGQGRTTQTSIHDRVSHNARRRGSPGSSPHHHSKVALGNYLPSETPVQFSLGDTSDDDDDKSTSSSSVTSPLCREDIPDRAIREAWKVGDKVEVFSFSKNQWMRAEIFRIFIESGRRWVEARFHQGLLKKDVAVEDTEAIRPIPKVRSGQSGNYPSPEEVDAQIRRSWKMGDVVLVFSNTKNQWFRASINRVYRDDVGEWLQVMYDKYSKEISRKDLAMIKPTESAIAAMEAHLRSVAQNKDSSDDVYTSGTSSDDETPAQIKAVQKEQVAQTAGAPMLKHSSRRVSRGSSSSGRTSRGKITTKSPTTTSSVGKNLGAAIRKSWKKGDKVEIYSVGSRRWFNGEINDIKWDDQGEWLIVHYSKAGRSMKKEVKRRSKYVRPVEVIVTVHSMETGAQVQVKLGKKKGSKVSVRYLKGIISEQNTIGFPVDRQRLGVLQKLEKDNGNNNNDNMIRWLDDDRKSLSECKIGTDSIIQLAKLKPLVFIKEQLATATTANTTHELTIEGLHITVSELKARILKLDEYANVHRKNLRLSFQGRLLRDDKISLKKLLVRFESHFDLVVAGGAMRKKKAIKINKARSERAVDYFYVLGLEKESMESCKRPEPKQQDFSDEGIRLVTAVSDIRFSLDADPPTDMHIPVPHLQNNPSRRRGQKDGWVGTGYIYMSFATKYSAAGGPLCNLEVVSKDVRASDSREIASLGKNAQNKLRFSRTKTKKPVVALGIVRSRDSVPTGYQRLEPPLQKTGYLNSKFSLCIRYGDDQDQCYDPQLLDRYPRYDYSDYPREFSEKAFSPYCFPNGIHLTQFRPMPHGYFFHNFSFSLGAERRVFYGSAMTIFEEFGAATQSMQQAPLPPPRHSTAIKYHSKPSDRVWCPKCLVLIAQEPYYVGMQRFLYHLYNVAMTPQQGQQQTAAVVPIESWIYQFFNALPDPVPGVLKVEFNIGSSLNPILFSKPPPVFMSQEGMNIAAPLFRCLDAKNVVRVYEMILAESQILLISKDLSLLNTVAEAYRCLLFPFEWHRIWIPLLPAEAQFANFLMCGWPFVIGVQSSFFNRFILPEEEKGKFELVDLDNNLVQEHANRSPRDPADGSLPGAGPPAPELPARIRQPLLSQLEVLEKKFFQDKKTKNKKKSKKKEKAQSRTSSISSIDEGLLYRDVGVGSEHRYFDDVATLAFLKANIQIVYRYQDYCTAENTMDFKRFVADSGGGGGGAEGKGFYDLLVETQIFRTFADWRSAPDFSDLCYGASKRCISLYVQKRAPTSPWEERRRRGGGGGEVASLSPMLLRKGGGGGGTRSRSSTREKSPRMLYSSGANHGLHHHHYPQAQFGSSLTMQHINRFREQLCWTETVVVSRGREVLETLNLWQKQKQQQQQQQHEVVEKEEDAEEGKTADDNQQQQQLQITRHTRSATVGSPTTFSAFPKLDDALLTRSAALFNSSASSPSSSSSSGVVGTSRPSSLPCRRPRHLMEGNRFYEIDPNGLDHWLSEMRQTHNQMINIGLQDVSRLAQTELYRLRASVDASGKSSRFKGTAGSSSGSSSSSSSSGGSGGSSGKKGHLAPPTNTTRTTTKTAVAMEEALAMASLGCIYDLWFQTYLLSATDRIRRRVYMHRNHPDKKDIVMSELQQVLMVALGVIVRMLRESLKPREESFKMLALFCAYCQVPHELQMVIRLTIMLYPSLPSQFYEQIALMISNSRLHLHEQKIVSSSSSSSSGSRSNTSSDRQQQQRRPKGKGPSKLPLWIRMCARCDNCSYAFTGEDILASYAEKGNLPDVDCPACGSAGIQPMLLVKTHPFLPAECHKVVNPSILYQSFKACCRHRKNIVQEFEQNPLDEFRFEPGYRWQFWNIFWYFASCDLPCGFLLSEREEYLAQIDPARQYVVSCDTFQSWYIALPGVDVEFDRNPGDDAQQLGAALSDVVPSPVREEQVTKLVDHIEEAIGVGGVPGRGVSRLGGGDLEGGVKSKLPLQALVKFLSMRLVLAQCADWMPESIFYKQSMMHALYPVASKLGISTDDYIVQYREHYETILQMGDRDRSGENFNGLMTMDAVPNEQHLKYAGVIRKIYTNFRHNDTSRSHSMLHGSAPLTPAAAAAAPTPHALSSQSISNSFVRSSTPSLRGPGVSSSSSSSSSPSWSLVLNNIISKIYSYNLKNISGARAPLTPAWPQLFSFEGSYLPRRWCPIVSAGAIVVCLSVYGCSNYSQRVEAAASRGALGAVLESLVRDMWALIHDGEGAGGADDELLQGCEGRVDLRVLDLEPDTIVEVGVQPRNPASDSEVAWAVAQRLAEYRPPPHPIHAVGVSGGGGRVQLPGTIKEGHDSSNICANDKKRKKLSDGAGKPAKKTAALPPSAASSPLPPVVVSGGETTLLRQIMDTPVSFYPVRNDDASGGGGGGGGGGDAKVNDLTLALLLSLVPDGTTSSDKHPSSSSISMKQLVGTTAEEEQLRLSVLAFKVFAMLEKQGMVSKWLYAEGLQHNFHSKERPTDRVRIRKRIKRARWKRSKDREGKEAAGGGDHREKMKIYERQRQYQYGWSSKLLPNEGYCWSADMHGHSCVAMGSALCVPPPGMRFRADAEWDYIRNEKTDVNGWITSEEEPTRYRIWTCEIVACSTGTCLEPKLLPSTRRRRVPTTPRYHPTGGGAGRSEVKIEHKKIPYLPMIRHFEAPYLHVERIVRGKTQRVLPGDDSKSVVHVPPIADSECEAFNKLWPGKRESRLEFAISTHSEFYLTDISFSEIKHLMSVGCPVEPTVQHGSRISFRHSNPATGRQQRRHHHTKSQLIDEDFVFLDRIRSFNLECGSLELSPLALQRTVTNARVLIQEHLLRKAQSLFQRHKSRTKN